MTRQLPCVSLVIPLYNNQRTAGEQLRRCYRILNGMHLKFEMILCNDGSADGTGKIIGKFAAAHKNVRLINHSRNLGIAASLRDLYGRARYPYTMLFSADGEWNPEDLRRLVRCLKSRGADIVIGRRLQKQYSPARKAVSFFYNFLPWLLFGVRTYDAGSIKIFRTGFFRERKLVSRSIFQEAEMLIRAGRDGAIIKTVEISHNPKLDRVKSGVNLRAVTESFYDVIRLKIGN